MRRYQTARRRNEIFKMNGKTASPLAQRSCGGHQAVLLDASFKENDMSSKSKFLKTTILAALVGLTAAVAVTPASAHEYDRHRGYERDRGRDDRGWGDRDRGYRGWDRHDRDDRGWGYGHHRHRGWY